jgi:hypothetical protein
MAGDRHNFASIFQYLSGVDLPLKTNLEMVRIFKQLNGTINAEVTKFQPERLKGEAKKVGVTQILLPTK